MTRTNLAVLSIFAGSFLSGVGCISIPTHERMMADCRATSKELGGVREQIAQLEQERRNLEDKLTVSGWEKEDLESQLSEMKNTYTELSESLKEDISRGDVGIDNSGDNLTIALGNKVLFKSGRAELQDKGRAILKSVSDSLKKISDNEIHVEGHTDNVPIKGKIGLFANNWDLSAARAASVVRFLQEKGGVNPKLLVLSAFGEFRPVAENSSTQGREQNRRVDITLHPRKKGERE